MLVLTRKNREAVVIGDGLHRLLKVNVLEVREGWVKLGFEANDDLLILRSEIWQRICPRLELKSNASELVESIAQYLPGRDVSQRHDCYLLKLSKGMFYGIDPTDYRDPPPRRRPAPVAA